ncbi:MAG: ADP-ribose pyrophosphatase [Spirochaetes bacterium RBG_13_51_14]|nr:MAG: ADP-ribose pyrophosphatase [Spirochaetes bacterium RBG_13_51_14]
MAHMQYCPWCGGRLGSKVIEGRELTACAADSCGYVFWDNPLPVVAAIVEHEGSVILARGKGWPEKIFGIITGFLERGETPEEAVVREVREELGLSAKIEGFVGIYPFFQKNQLLLVYHLSAEGEITISDELEEIKHISPEKLRPWAFGTGPAVKDWLEKRKM